MAKLEAKDAAKEKTEDSKKSSDKDDEDDKPLSDDDQSAIEFAMDEVSFEEGE